MHSPNSETICTKQLQAFVVLTKNICTDDKAKFPIYKQTVWVGRQKLREDERNQALKLPHHIERNGEKRNFGPLFYLLTHFNSLSILMTQSNSDFSPF